MVKVNETKPSLVQVLKEIQFDQVVCHFHSTSYGPNYK